METLNNLERFYLSRFQEAQERFCDDDNPDECYSICRELLFIPEIPFGFRAGAHIMLAHDDENRLYHAEQAVYYCQEIVSRRPDNLEYQGALEESRALLQAAENEYKDEVAAERQAAEALEQPATGQAAGQDAEGVASGGAGKIVGEMAEEVAGQIAGQLAGEVASHVGQNAEEVAEDIGGLEDV